MDTLHQHYQKALDSFLNYMLIERNFSVHTRESYSNDLKRYLLFMQHSSRPMEVITHHDIEEFMGELYA